jgi:hypothetical protein
MAQIEKCPGGFSVDGLVFRRGKCGCSGMGGDCCYTYSKVKKDGNTIIYEGKATAPSTSDNYLWGYRVRQGDVVVDVKMEDTRDNKDFFSGSYPPPLSAFKEKGWQVEDEFERPLEE